MENSETSLSKTEYNYIRAIEKADELIAKQDEALKKQDEDLKKEKLSNEQLTKQLETLNDSSGISVKELNEMKTENEKLKADLLETTKECQIHVDDIEAQNDALLEHIEELKLQILPEEEMLFYYSCKADVVLNNLYAEKEEVTLKELQENKFPMILLETEGSEPSGINTTNYMLKKSKSGNNYEIINK